MHRFHTCLTVFAFIFVCACANEPGVTTPGPSAAETGTGGGEIASARVPDCVIDTIQLKNGVEFAQDLEAGLGSAFIYSFGSGFLKQARVPNVLSSPLVITNEFGAYIYSFHGWDLVPVDLAPEGSTGSGLVAVLQGSVQVEAKRVFARKRYAAAKSLFDALTRATETKTDHIVPSTQVYDRSWVRLRRSTPKGRLVCDKVVYPDSGPAATYTCVINGVDWKEVQAFDTAEGGGFCPSP